MFEHRAQAMTRCCSGNNLSIKNQPRSSVIYPLTVLVRGQERRRVEVKGVTCSVPLKDYMETLEVSDHVTQPSTQRKISVSSNLDCRMSRVFCSQAQGPRLLL